jgi:uncharacterized protein YndB with AHSA1/START domain
MTGDQVRVSVLLKVPPAEAFRAFTEDIDQWWRRGVKYRVQGPGRGLLHLEPRVGGRLFEQFDGDPPSAVQTGTVRVWQPPSRLVCEWRGVNFAAGDSTEVELTFEPAPGGAGTQVTLVHRGFASLRDDHPVRHGQTVAAFIRGMGLWWGDQLTSLRVHANPQPP